MRKLSKNLSEMKKQTWTYMAAFVLAFIMVFGTLLQTPVFVNAASASCKTLCQAVLKETGGGDKLKFQSKKPEDFGGFTVADREKVSSVMYVCDEKEAYAVCVVKASSNTNASDLLKSLKSYKSNNSSSDYLSDYSSEEQKVFKSAVCGKKGKYVWYIAMSSKKSVNKNGQTALKEKLS